MKTCKVCKKSEGIEGAVYIGRGSIWGNPFVMHNKHDVAERREVCQRYADYLRSRADLLARLPELRGKWVACYCCSSHEQRSEHTLCHGHVIARFLSEYTDEQLQSGNLS